MKTLITPTGRPYEAVKHEITDDEAAQVTDARMVWERVVPA